MALVSWLVAGVAVAVLAHRLPPGHTPGGIAGELVAGVLGAVLGGLLFAIRTGQAAGTVSVGSLVLAAAGALVVIGLFRLAAGTPNRRITKTARRS